MGDERCLLVDSLSHQVKELWEEVDRLQNICSHEVFIYSMHKEASNIMREEQLEKALEDAPLVSCCHF